MVNSKLPGKKEMLKFYKDASEVAVRGIRRHPLIAGLSALLAALVFVVVLFDGETPALFGTVRWPHARQTRLGDNPIWLGMEMCSITRSVRKEFNIPGKVKGVMVIERGRKLGARYGVEAFDVICEVNRRPVKGTASFIEVVSELRYYDGILLDVYRQGKRLYISVPVEYAFGPLYGPNKGHWQLGSPLWGQAFPYGTSWTAGRRDPRNTR